MNDEDRNTQSTNKGNDKESETRLMGAERLVGNDVCNENGENLGNIKEIMIQTLAMCVMRCCPSAVSWA